MDVDIPVVLCVITQGSLGLSHANYMGIGLGANVDRRKAEERAYAEALEILANFYSFADESIRPRAVALESPPIDLKTYFDDALFLVASQETRQARVGTLPASSGKIDELRECLARLGDAGLATYYCDLTPPVLRDRVRYRLIRAFASYLQPHLYEWDAWRLENPRLYSAPVQAGHRITALSRNELNLEPNPFTVIENLSRS
jgi:ribosomal protein S12 methylthiotransferase accessory factor YcaO